MFVYHFLPAQHALDDIRQRHLKLSEIDKLNDPFELWCSDQGDRELRRILQKWKADMARRYGLLCFTLDWHNPILWSLYADRHSGICLGLGVPSRCIKAVKYVASRLPLELPLTEESVQELTFTKYQGWEHEQEWRGWFRLETPDEIQQLYFYEFDDKVQLREVIVGHLCKVRKSTVEAALSGYRGDVNIIKARLAFRSFNVVEQGQGFGSVKRSSGEGCV